MLRCDGSIEAKLILSSIQKGNGKTLQNIAIAICCVLLGVFNHPALFMYPRKKVGADPLWNCDASPPGDLIKSLHLERTAVNEDELSRAEWFWNRRPRLLCGNLIFCFCYLVVFVCLVYLFPESAPSLLLWMVAGVSCAFVDCVRFERWRNEYRSSIKRIVFHMTKF